jgi:hypothetical protein
MAEISESSFPNFRVGEDDIKEGAKVPYSYQKSSINAICKTVD